MKHGKGWSAWNVGLWLMNDEGMYRLTRDMVRRTRTRDEAAERIAETLSFCGIASTPDGARYTKTSIRAALVGWEGRAMARKEPKNEVYLAAELVQVIQPSLARRIASLCPIPAGHYATAELEDENGPDGVVIVRDTSGSITAIMPRATVGRDTCSNQERGLAMRLSG